MLDEESSRSLYVTPTLLPAYIFSHLYLYVARTNLSASYEYLSLIHDLKNLQFNKLKANLQEGGAGKELVIGDNQMKNYP